MNRVEKTIVVNVPVRTAYHHWTQFESFHEFMEGVKEVRQLDDRRLQWRVEIAGKEKTWEAAITEQVPDRKISWTSTGGAYTIGTVSFESAGPETCRITVVMGYDPEGFVENVGAALGVVGARVEGDLQRFKNYVESLVHETGAWRGEFHGRRSTRRSEPSNRPSPRTAEPPH